MPTAPEILPTAIVVARAAQARRRRAAARAYHSRQLQPERHRLGVHAVRAADHRRVAVLLGAARGSTRQQRVEAVEDQVARLAPSAAPARCRRRRTRSARSAASGALGPDVLGDVGRERDQVVLRDLLDLVDARDVEVAALADVPRRLAPARCRPRPWLRRRRFRRAATFRSAGCRSRCAPWRGVCSVRSREVQSTRRPDQSARGRARAPSPPASRSRTDRARRAARLRR